MLRNVIIVSMKWINIKRPTFQIFLLLLVAVLLPVLALLQYDWVNKMSEREATRMRQNLETSANRFAEDFDRELSNLNAAFSTSSVEGSAQDLMKEAYGKWLKATSVPQLIQKLYLATPGIEGKAELQEYLTAEDKFIPTKWPDNLLEFREKFDGYALKSSRGNYKLSSRILTGEKLTVFLPKIILTKVDEKEAGRKANYSGVLLQLDADYLKEEILPALTERYFKAGGAIDYNIQIREKHQGNEVFYSSNPQFQKAFETDDYHTDFFSLRFQTLFYVNLKRENEDANVWATKSNTAIKIITERSGNKENEIIREDIIGPEHSEIRKSEERIEIQGDFLFNNVDSASIKFGDSGNWLLSVRHKSGSLSTAVTERRYINLFISFGILLTLALSIMILIFNSRKAQKLARQQMEFVAGVSHELRTPLAVIRSAGENLADLIVNDTERTRQYGLLIEKEGRRLSEMVEKVLLFSRVQSGNLCLNPVPVDLNQIIEEATNLCESALREGNFILVKELEENLPTVSGDRQTLVNIIVNLISNAVKYSGESNWIGIKSFYCQPGLVIMEISDKGLGISLEDQKKIFEAFFRSEFVRNEQIEGTGLGLSLVKRIVKEHGGEITVESEPGQGSTFRVSLPTLVDQHSDGEKNAL